MSYLNQYDAAPAAERFGLLRGWMKSEPLPLFAELRKGRPILFAEEATLVARHADVIEVLGHPSVFTVGPYVPKMRDFMLAQDDTPSHSRDKAVMQAMLNRDDAPRVREIVARNAGKALDEANGRIELVSEFARKVPIRLVGEYFGFPGPDPATMMRWSYLAQLDNFHNHPFQGLADGEGVHRRADEAKAEMARYLAGLIPQRLQQIKEHPDLDDILSRLLRTSLPPGVGFGMDRVVINTIGMLVGAVETTAQAVVQAIDELLKRPGRLAEAKEAAAGGDQERFDGYVYEAMRFHPIAPYLFRVAAEDYTLAKGTDREATIAAGSVVLALTWSAMFDPDEVDRPGEFRPGRPHHGHLHFGYGLHRCLGEHVAGVMIPEMVRGVILREHLRPAPGDSGRIDYRGGPFPEHWVLVFDA